MSWRRASERLPPALQHSSKYYDMTEHTVDLPITGNDNVLWLHRIMERIWRRIEESEIRHKGVKQGSWKGVLRRKTVPDRVTSSTRQLSQLLSRRAMRGRVA